VGDVVRVESADEADLKRHVQGGAEEHRADHSQRDVPFRVACLAGELCGLFEPLEREDHA
jgi:hypothetical protein